MIQKLKTKLLALAGFLILASPLLVPVVANAANNSAGGSNIQSQACAGAQNLVIGTTGTDNESSTGCPTGDNATSSVNNLLTDIINIFSVVVGIVAVIMIVVGAFRYITSGGDSTKVGNAKNTILYALIGLVIVALSQIIVKFVLAKSTSIGTGS